MQRKTLFFLFTRCSLSYCISLVIFSYSLCFSLLFHLLSLTQFFKIVLSSHTGTSHSLIGRMTSFIYYSAFLLQLVGHAQDNRYILHTYGLTFAHKSLLHLVLDKFLSQAHLRSFDKECGLDSWVSPNSECLPFCTAIKIRSNKVSFDELHVMLHIEEKSIID